MAYTVYLDPGHGGYDNGARAFGRTEKDDNLDLALAVGEILQNNGVNVGYTRTEDVYDSPLRKAQIANEAGADLFVSFHRNSGTQANQYNGVQTLLYNENGLKKEMADAINSALEEVGFRNLGTESRTDLAVLRRTQMPALLLEVGFINSEKDNAIFEQNFDDIAHAIAAAIYNTLLEDGLISGRAMVGAQAMGSGNAGNKRDANIRTTDNRNTGSNGNMGSNRNTGNGGKNGNGGNAGDNRKPGRRDDDQCDDDFDDDFDDGFNVDYDDENDDDEIGGSCTNHMSQCMRKPAYQIQTGLFRNYANALRLKARLERDGFPAMIQIYQEFFAVMTGYYRTLERAEQAEKKLQALGYDTLIRTVR